MNVAAHQEKQKNEGTKTGKKKAGEEGRHVIDFKGAACCPFVVIQGAAQLKNGLCKGSAQGNWDSWQGQQPF